MYNNDEDILSYVENLKKIKNKVKSQEYLNWLESFCKSNNEWNDEDILYENIKEEDKENCKIISKFFDYIKTLEIEQLVFNDSEKFDRYYEGDFSYFKYNNNYYYINTICGQGCCTYVKLLEDIPLENFVTLDNDLSSEELKQRELIEYIIVNKDLNISSAKYCVHACHASTIAALAQQNNLKFKVWYNDGKNQKKVILETKQKKLETLEKDFYSVRDLGFTEVAENTLIAVSLGVMSRKEAQKYIKGFQTWKK